MKVLVSGEGKLVVFVALRVVSDEVESSGFSNEVLVIEWDIAGIWDEERKPPPCGLQRMTEDAAIMWYA